VAQLIMDDITTDSDWKNGDYAAQRGAARRTAAAVHRRERAARATTSRTHARLRRRVHLALDRQPPRRTDANDLLYQVAASRDYDPSAALDRIGVRPWPSTPPTISVNPPELGMMERLIARVKQGRYILIPTSDRTRGHGTHTAAAVWKEYFAPFVASLERR